MVYAPTVFEDDEPGTSVVIMAKSHRARQNAPGSKALQLRPASEDRAPTEVRASPTLGAYAAQWLAAELAAPVAPAQVANLRWAVERWIIPHLGDRGLDQLSPSDVDRFFETVAEAGYSASTLRRLRSVLGRICTRAQRAGLLAANPCVGAPTPRTVPRAPRRALNAEATRRLLQAARSERFEVAIIVGLALGLRPGELLALRWGDVDLAAGILHVRCAMRRVGGRLIEGPLKASSAAERTLAVPRPALSALCAHRFRQLAVRLAAPRWEEERVFCGQEGRPLDPDTLRASLARVARRAGLPHIVPYQLRHTASSHMVDAGVPVDQVGDVLGSSPGTVLRVYRHRVREVADGALGPMSALLGGAPEGACSASGA